MREEFKHIKDRVNPIFDFGDDEYKLYNDLVSRCESAIISSINELLLRMFEHNSIPRSRFVTK